MASTELLASKIVILEEEPSIPAISTLPSAVLLCCGITERGPIADRHLFTSFEEYKKVYGGFTANANAAIGVYNFFNVGGSFAWVSRTVHFTDVTDASTHTATKATIDLYNSGSAASPASVGPGTETQNFNLTSGAHLDLDIGAGTVASTFTAAAASITDTATYPIAALAGTETMGITVAGANGGAEQTITATATVTTADGVAAFINSQIVGASASVSGGQVVITTDKQGTDAGVQVTTAGTLNAILGFPTSATSGTGNVADITAVTGSEVEAVVEAAMSSAVTVTVSGTGAITIATVGTGASAQIQVIGTSTVDFGLDSDPHTGSDAAAEVTLTVDAKTEGAYANSITLKVENASSGESERFNFKVLVDSVVKETFVNLTMDTTDAFYVETVINDTTYGSDLIAVTDAGLAVSTLLKRPANITSSAMTGGGDGLVGLLDSDYIGSESGPTGLYCFDVVTGGRILIVPGVYTAAVHQGMLDYAETHRNGSMFCVLDCPPGYTAAEVVTYVETTASLLEYSEFGAIYWPWVKIVNPSSGVFGNVDTITVAPSGLIAGKYALNDQENGGVYESPAGIGNGWGILPGVVGVEDDPGGSATHEVEDERKRDLVYPKRINPITKLPSTPWHIDGGRTLKSTENFPHVAQRRGVIFIEQTLKDNLIIFKHRANNVTTRSQAKRVITAFLVREMNKGAFASTNQKEAFFVDVSDQINPLANIVAGIMTIRIGLAMNTPAEFIVLRVTQDTRALEESLQA